VRLLVRLKLELDLRQLLLDVELLLLELVPALVELGLEAALEVGAVVPLLPLAEQRLIAPVVAADRLALRDQRLGLFDSRPELCALGLDLRPAPGELGEPVALLL